MRDTTRPVREPPLEEPVQIDTEIDSLAGEMHMPREFVAELYAKERAKIERTARIKTYVPVLIRSEVKALLRDRRRRSEEMSL
jgi:hypothetical protein